MTTTLTKDQTKTFHKLFYEGDHEYIIYATVRYDDRCGNGHNTFSITGEIWKSRNGKKVGREGSCGMIHADIAKHFPELSPLLKWHLCSSDGPMYYVENTVYLACDRGCDGLREGEKRHLQNGRTGDFVWRIVIRDATSKEVSEGAGHWCDSPTKPPEILTAAWEPVWIVGKGKARELDHARSSAIWPDATDEDLTAPGLEDRLNARLPQLMVEFRQAVESLGFTY